MSPDYAEVLRLSRKYQLRPDEPLWETFVRVGRQLENSRPKRERCLKCHRTEIEFKRTTDANGIPLCDDPWHEITATS